MSQWVVDALWLIAGLVVAPVALTLLLVIVAVVGYLLLLGCIAVLSVLDKWF